MAKKTQTKSTSDVPFAVKEWPAARIEMWKVSRIIPYEKNARTHPEDQIEALATDMMEDGVTTPILVDEKGVIIAGHGRRLAAIANKFEEYPVAVARGWTETQKRAARIKDNQRGLQSGWDTQVLRMELTDLKAEGLDLEVLGFDQAELEGFFPSADEKPDPERIPVTPKAPIVRAGDVWHLGAHRLICGDSTDMTVWAKLFGKDRAAMVFTDPPYGVSYEASSGEFGVIEGDKKRRDDLYQMLLKAFRGLAKYTEDEAGFYIWHADMTRADFSQAMTAVGIIERQYLAWAKPGNGLGNKDYVQTFEPCFYASKEGRKPKFYGSAGQGAVWRFGVVGTDDTAITIGGGVAILDGNGSMVFVQAKPPKTKKIREVRLTEERPAAMLTGGEPGIGTVWEVSRDTGYVHPTQKPVELAVLAINNSSKRGDLVVDCFTGSGTTLIGAEIAGRQARCIELDPVYAQVIIERWQSFTKKTATLETGETLDELAKTRKAKARDSGKSLRRRESVPAAGRNPKMAK